MYKHFFKRIIDFIGALFFLILISPIFFVISIILFVLNKGSIFFTQDRPGYRGKKFRLIKFKSMNDQKDENGNLLQDNVRLTKAGAIIRKTSLDELPQLINVLKGDMSLVGPRPAAF